MEKKWRESETEPDLRSEKNTYEWNQCILLLCIHTSAHLTMIEFKSQHHRESQPIRFHSMEKASEFEHPTRRMNPFFPFRIAYKQITFITRRRKDERRLRHESFDPFDRRDKCVFGVYTYTRGPQCDLHLSASGRPFAPFRRCCCSVILFFYSFTSISRMENGRNKSRAMRW